MFFVFFKWHYKFKDLSRNGWVPRLHLQCISLVFFMFWIQDSVLMLVNLVVSVPPNHPERKQSNFPCSRTSSRNLILVLCLFMFGSNGRLEASVVMNVRISSWRTLKIYGSVGKIFVPYRWMPFKDPIYPALSLPIPWAPSPLLIPMSDFPSGLTAGREYPSHTSTNIFFLLSG